MCSKGSTDSAATLLRARVPQGSPLGGVFVVAIRILGGAFLSVIRVSAATLLRVYIRFAMLA